MQERGDGALFVEAVLGGEGERVDAAKIAIGRFAHRLLDGGGAVGIGRLPQHAEKGFGFAHRWLPLTLKCRAGNVSIGRQAGDKAHRREARLRQQRASQRIDPFDHLLVRDQRRRQMAGEDLEIFALRIFGAGIKGVFRPAAIDRIELAGNP